MFARLRRPRRPPVCSASRQAVRLGFIAACTVVVLLTDTPYVCFDEELRRTLEAWQVPSVQFAEYEQYMLDIRAGGRWRASRGKGVRSVLHSAFTTSLASYCLANERPHPGFIVLDSPVVTYRDPINDPVDDDVDLTSNVVEHFYRDMLRFPGQAVIIENDDPPADVIAQARTYRFAGSKAGRSGFFPAPTGNS